MRLEKHFLVQKILAKPISFFTKNVNQQQAFFIHFLFSMLLCGNEEGLCFLDRGAILKLNIIFAYFGSHVF